jgi:eukaryotic-like serine/threonine-protein kinase
MTVHMPETEFIKASENMKRREPLRWVWVAVARLALLLLVVLGVTGQLNRFIYYPVDMDDYWVTIPAGEFQMGSDNGESYEQPVHTVYIDEYQIGKYEITNRQYAQCGKAGICSGESAFTEDKALHPVVNVTWDDAETYCKWVGGRLPTEAEWEKAASWDDKAKRKYIYPWGNQLPTSNLLNYNGDIGDTTPVGKYKSGKSPYRLYDMAGNVWEWVNDWYDDYQRSPSSTPLGPADGQYKVLRGGSWYIIVNYVRSASRYWKDPAYISGDVGFRCSRSP